MGEQRFGTLGGGGARIVASCLAIEDEHGLGRKILSGACELGLGAGTNRPSVASTTIMQSSKATGTYLKRLKRGGRPKQPLTLHLRRDRLSPTADRQDAVGSLFVVDAIGEVSTEIIVADGFAAGQFPVAED